MNPGTFLKNTERITTGKGFKRAVPVHLNECHKYDDGALLTTTVTAAGYDMLDTGSKQRVIFVDDDETSMFGFNFSVPEDYDESVDKLRIRALVSMDGGTTDTVYLDAEIYRKRAGAAATADLDPTIDPVRIPAAIASAAWSEVDADGNDLQGGDQLTVVLKTAAHTTDGMLVYGIEVVYAADLVYYDQDDRAIS